MPRTLHPTVAAVLAAVAVALPASADERYDHRGSIGLLVSLGAEYKTAINPTGALPTDDGPRGDAEVGGTLAVGYDGDELKLAVRGAFFGPMPDVSAIFGFRNYFGKDQWKTFMDLDIAGHFTPHLTAGVRFGIGLQWDFLPVVGTYLTLAGQIGFGQALRFSGELLLGFQFRTYVLE